MAAGVAIDSHAQPVCQPGLPFRCAAGLLSTLGAIAAMNNADRYARGARLLDDAQFVKDVLIDTAFRAEKWNIVVFEAYRSAELLIKGITYSAGYAPRRHHRLHSLVERLSAILEKNKHRLPFIHKAVDPTGNCYRLLVAGGTLQLLKQISGTYSLLGSTTRLQKAYLPPRLVLSGTNISVFQGPKKILSTCDSSVSNTITYEKEFLRAPDEVRLERLRKLVQILLSTREEAFYHEQTFYQGDAEDAVRMLSTVFELSGAFEVYERLRRRSFSNGRN